MCMDGWMEGRMDGWIKVGGKGRGGGRALSARTLQGVRAYKSCSTRRRTYRREDNS